MRRIQIVALLFFISWNFQFNAQNISDKKNCEPKYSDRSRQLDGGSKTTRIFFDTAGKIAMKYTRHLTWGSCNDEGHELSDHQLKNDTLVVYTYWFHAGDPSGHEWGGRIMRFRWDCAGKKLKKIDGRLYIEELGVSGGLPVLKDDDSSMVKEREEFKRQMEKQYKGKFVIGKEAKLLVQECYSFLKPEIKEYNAYFEKIYSSGFGWRIEPDFKTW